MYELSTGASFVQMSQKDVPYNPAQIDQFAQLEDPGLPEFLYHLEEDEDPLPSFAMTNLMKP